MAANSATSTGVTVNGALQNAPTFSTATAATCPCGSGYYDVGVAACSGKLFGVLSFVCLLAVSC